MNQKILEGHEIFPALRAEIDKSRSEILVATAWFTDFKLFDLLLKKQKNGIKVKVIIADTEENNKLDFNELNNAGGNVYKVKNNGFGMMHEKYCVIDNNIAIHGSYNWTVNARNNNQESVILTDHNETVNKLKQNFLKMETNVVKQLNQTNVMEGTNPFNKTDVLDTPKKNNWFSFRKLFSRQSKPSNGGVTQVNKPNDVKSQNKSVDEVFDTIISAEIKKTEKEEIKTLGKERAVSVNGDAGVLRQSMDILYQIFITDTSKVEAKKENLKLKIDSKTEEITANYEMDKNREKKLKEEQYLLKDKEYKERITDLEGKKKIKENEIEHIKTNIIPGFSKKIEEAKEAISQLKVEFVKPKIKYYELIPLFLILIGLGIALFLFYSSSAYIMLYAKDDALEMLRNGITPIAEVFNSKALSLAAERGGTAVIYLSFFVFIPLSIAYVAHKGNMFYKIFGVISVIILDVFVAYKVADTINEINYLSNGIHNEEPLYADVNVWLVFILSSIPFIFFMYIMGKILDMFEERHPEAGKAKADFQIKQLEKNIKSFNDSIQSSQNDIHSLQKEAIEIDNEISNTKEKLSNLAQDHPKALDMIESGYNDKIRYLKSKSDVYKNNIDNDNVPILFADLKARVSSFLEGWNEWLHEEFSVSKAINYSERARVEADKWLEENIVKDKSTTLKMAS